MTARAPARRSSRPGLAVEALTGAAALAVALVFTGHAQAQLAASASLASDYRYRGVSLSEGRPAVAMSLAWEPDSGLYAGASAVGGGSGPELLSHSEYLGYAKRLSGDWSWDAGVSNLTVASAYGGVRGKEAFEGYAGLRGRRVGVYAYYSPRYLGDGGQTLYLAVDAASATRRGWRMIGHLAALTPIGDHAPENRRAQFDLRVGVARAFKGGEAQLAWTSRRPGGDAASGYAGDRDAVVFTLTGYF